jgi:hypothetical protein
MDNSRRNSTLYPSLANKVRLKIAVCGGWSRRNSAQLFDEILAKISVTRLLLLFPSSRAYPSNLLLIKIF